MILSIPTLVRELLKEGRLAGETFSKNYKGGCGVVWCGPLCEFGDEQGEGTFQLSKHSSSEPGEWLAARRRLAAARVSGEVG